MSSNNAFCVWYFPSFSGDFRLEVREDRAGCVLTIETPTSKELKRLQEFIRHAHDHKEGWLLSGPKPRISRKGKTVIHIQAPIEQAGPVLAGVALEGSAIWTAVRSVAGKISLVSGLPSSEIAVVDASAAAVSIRPPDKGCPAPEPCNHRASEVLMAFSTPRQIREWRGSGYMTVFGSTTGQSYRVYHRNTAARRGLSRALVKCRTGEPVCAYDPLVPAEEEALALKLAVEHRERWLLDLGVRR